MKNLSKKQIIIGVVIISIVIGTIGIYVYKKAKEDNNIEYDNIIEYGTDNIDETVEVNKILIHIFGCIKDSGIVILNEGDRIIDAIEAAGGETAEADLNKINLAYVLNDGERLYIPSKTDNEDIKYITDESGENVIQEGAGAREEKAKETIININTATKEELTTLTGIGESTANKIIEYRKLNGKFTTIEEIKEVPGIGDAKFETIKNYIKVK